jgi:hypothetical protein
MNLEVMSNIQGSVFSNLWQKYEKTMNLGIFVCLPAVMKI